MIENLQWKPNEPEKEPVVTLNVNDGESKFELNRLNTSLFRFMGNLAIYNHVFYHDIHEEETPLSFYVFKFSPVYQQLEDYLTEHQYPVHDNMTEVSEVDFEAYLNYQDASIPDTLPEDW